MWMNRELKHTTFLSHGRQPEVTISRARTVVSLRFSNWSYLLVKRDLTTLMWKCGDKLNTKTAHFRLPSVPQKRCMLKFLLSIKHDTLHFTNKVMFWNQSFNKNSNLEIHFDCCCWCPSSSIIYHLNYFWNHLLLTSFNRDWAFNKGISNFDSKSNVTNNVIQ